MINKTVTLLKGFLDFLSVLYRRRALIYEMAKRDIMSHHVGSLLGFFWTFINPLVMIFVLWFVFTFGFKPASQGALPFVVWLTAGMAVWNTFSESISGSTRVITGNVHLVKKVVFPLSILPVVKLAASFITHSVFVFFLIILISLYGMPVSLYWFQAVYYFIAMSILALGLGWIVSSVNVFARDTGQIVGVVLQFGFWATPVFWDVELMLVKIRGFLKLNPMHYIVQGYRDSFFNFVPFWRHWEQTLWFWGIAGFVFCVGALIFLKLRPHFADVV